MNAVDTSGRFLAVTDGCKGNYMSLYGFKHLGEVCPFLIHFYNSDCSICFFDILKSFSTLLLATFHLLIIWQIKFYQVQQSRPKLNVGSHKTIVLNQESLQLRKIFKIYIITYSLLDINLFNW